MWSIDRLSVSVRVPIHVCMDFGITSPRIRLRRAALAILGVCLFGTVGFMVVEDWPFFDAFYFTLVTITTVGYGDYGLTEDGRIFTTLLLVGGISVATYSVGQAWQAVLDYQMNWESKMMRKASELDGHAIICGMGRVGSAVCASLAGQGARFVVITSSQQEAETARSLGYLVIVGDGTQESILEAAGIRAARSFASVTSSDADNIVATLSARELNPDIFILARAEREDAERKIRRAGASTVFSPVRTGGERIASTLLHPNLTEWLDTCGGSDHDIALGELKIGRGSVLDGALLRDYGATRPDLVVVAVIHSDGTRHLRPSSDRAFQAGDTLIIAGEHRTVRSMHADAGSHAAA